MTENQTLEWITSLPTGWSVVPLKYILEENSIKVGPFGSALSGNDFKDDGYWVYNQRTVVDENFEENTVFIDEEKYKSMTGFHVADGDILITTRGTIGHVCKVPPVYNKGIIHPCIIKFRLDENKLLFSLLKHIFNESDIIKNQLLFMSNATTIDVLYSSTLKNIVVPIPPKDKQRIIASYLDVEDVKIDALAADIKAQIDTLEQYERSVITEAVTKGLNPEAKMKDSHLEWVGAIPTHWDVHPVYTYFGERKNKNRFGTEDNLLSLSYGKVVRKDINTNDGLLPESFNTYNIVEAGDIIIRPTDLQNDKRSLRTGLVKERGIITSAYIDLFPIKKVDSRYFHFLLHSYDIMKVFYNMGNGVRQGLNYSEFSRLIVFEPPYDEQVAIANYLDAKCVEIDSIISQKKEQLATLDAYKKTLVYEYVTGKKEV